MSGQTILLIEDNFALAFGLEASLKSRGLKVMRVTNGEHAFDACKRDMPDLVVTDMIMDGQMDGFSFLANLRELPEGKVVPVIVISGLADSDSLKKIRNLDVQKILVKPFGLDRFIDAVLENL